MPSCNENRCLQYMCITIIINALKSGDETENVDIWCQRLYNDMKIETGKRSYMLFQELYSTSLNLYKWWR